MSENQNLWPLLFVIYSHYSDASSLVMFVGEYQRMMHTSGALGSLQSHSNLFPLPEILWRIGRFSQSLKFWTAEVKIPLSNLRCPKKECSPCINVSAHTWSKSTQIRCPIIRTWTYRRFKNLCVRPDYLVF